MKSLFIVPLKPNTVPSLRNIIMDKLDEIRSAYRDVFQIIVDERGSGDGEIKSLDERQSHIAMIRQSILNDVLRPSHQDVFWLDADVIEFEVGIIGELMKHRDAIAAPMVLRRRGKVDVFYDTAGFVKDGVWANVFWPFFKSEDPVLEMESVGAFYRIPARVFFTGAFYHPVAGFTEHYSVCEFARRKMGMKVLCDRRFSAHHANLPEYGDKTHAYE